MNNGDDQSQWTSAAWNVASAADLAFTADFASPVPEPRLAVLLFGMGFCLGRIVFGKSTHVRLRSLGPVRGQMISTADADATP